VPVPQVQTRLAKALPQITHHAREEPQFEGGVGLDLFDVFVGELIAPTLHLGDEIGLVPGCAPAANHAVDDCAESRLEEAEHVINADVRGGVQLLPVIGLLWVGKPPYVQGFSFDVADRIALPQHRRISDAP
jgi:hypothetical protein